MVKGKVIAIIQVRLGSTRLPAKAMLSINGKTILSRVIEQVNQSKIIDEIWIATSDSPSDDLIASYIEKKGLNLYRGCLENVYERFLNIVKQTNPVYFVRVTGDNPLTEPSFIEQAIQVLEKENADYASFDKIPYGSGIEAVKASTFLSLQNEELDEFYKEHVTLFLYKHPTKYKILKILPKPHLQRPEIRLTLDTIEDYNYLYELINKMEEKSIPLTLTNIVSYIDNHSEKK